jgi:hypothetical protein
MTVGDWIAWAFFIAAGLAVGGIALGWVPIGTARDRAQARLSRQVIGWSAVLIGVMLAIAFREPIAWAAAASLTGGGVAAIRTARERSLTDKVKPIRDLELKTVARQFVFDSRPPAKGRLEIHPKRGWTIFIGLAGVGALVLMVGAAWDTLGSDHVDWLGKVLFIGGFCGFFLLLIVIPSLWWAQRAIRRIPFLVLDSTGMTMGRSPSRDPWIGWDEIDGIDVRVVKSSGITDRILIVTPRDETSRARQPLLWRMAGAISRVLYGTPFPISTAFLAISFDELVARIEAHRPGLLQPKHSTDSAA